MIHTCSCSLTYRTAKARERCESQHEVQAELVSA